MNYSDLFKAVSKELGIPSDIVEAVYKSYFKFIKETIQELPLKNNITAEEFTKLRTNFNIPSLGKLTCNYNRMKGVKERFKYLKTKQNAKD